MNRPSLNPGEIPIAHRVLTGVVGSAFALIGILVLVHLWTEPFGFMHPPLFFRLFGSVIALVFVAFGGTMALSAISGRLFASLVRRGPQHRETGVGSGYRCPACGAGLSDDADVSPSGDVKCAYCRTWFNVHR